MVKVGVRVRVRGRVKGSGLRDKVFSGFRVQGSGLWLWLFRVTCFQG